jgi:hypothetical protein
MYIPQHVVWQRRGPRSTGLEDAAEGGAWVGSGKLDGSVAVMGRRGEGESTIYMLVLRGDYPGSQFCLGTMQARVALRKQDMASPP